MAVVDVYDSSLQMVSALQNEVINVGIFYSVKT